MVKTIANKGIASNVVDEYEQDKSNFDGYIKAGDTAKKKPKGVMYEDNRDPTDDNPNESLNFAGAEYFDIDNAMLNLPEPLENYEGTESFFKSIKNGIANLLRLLKNFGIWLIELFTNKTNKVRRRLNKLKTNIKINGEAHRSSITYPASIARLMTTLKLPTNGLWVSDALINVNSFLNAIEKGCKALEQEANLNRLMTSSEDVLKAAQSTAVAFAKAVGLTNDRYSLPGGKDLKLNTGERLSNVNIGMVINESYSPKGADFIPDITTTNTIVKNIEITTKTLERYHTSHTTAIRKFEQLVADIQNKTKYPTEVHQINAKRFYSWLVSFYQSAVSSSLQYVYSALFAGIGYCELNVRKTK